MTFTEFGSQSKALIPDHARLRGVEHTTTRPAGMPDPHPSKADADHAHAADWVNYTPTLSQGASTDIAKTVDWSRYIQIGRMVTWSFFLTATAAGTSGAAVIVTLPIDAASSVALQVGVGYVGDVSAVAAGAHVGNAQLASTSTLGFIVYGSVNYVGDVPTFAIANGDVIAATVTYESAA